MTGQNQWSHNHKAESLDARQSGRGEEGDLWKVIKSSVSPQKDRGTGEVNVSEEKWLTDLFFYF